MSESQNLSYAIIQAVHNLGAVATVGGSLLAASLRRLRDDVTRKRLAKLVLSGWLIQAASGASFGMISYYYEHQLPDISGIARYALGIKMLCATLGILLLGTYLQQDEFWSEHRKSHAWLIAAGLALTAICSAAVLRWFA
jgi:hypothetical protein